MSKKGRRARRITTPPMTAKQEVATANPPNAIKRHPIISTIVVLLGVAASIATIYSAIDPEIVAVSGAPKAAKLADIGRPMPGGFATTMHGTQKFENISIRGGAFVKDVKFVITSVDDALRPRVKLLNISNELFAARESKTINFDALVYFGAIGDRRFSPISLRLEFINNSGGVINDKATGKPYWLSYTINVDGEGNFVSQGVADPSK